MLNVFARTEQEVTEPLTRRVRFAFLALFVAGAGLRALASFQTLAIVHPDEHQQFLEQAHRLVYGYGHHFWEQERGMRHPVYPALLAIPLAGCEAAGVRDTLVQGALVRWTVSLCALLACMLFAFEFHRRGDTVTALTLMFLVALMPDVVYTHIHPLSETAATVPFLLALVWMSRRPSLAGLMLGLSFGIRFQMGFLVAATVFLVWLRNRGRLDWPFLKLSFGLALGLVGLGLSDKMVHGEWFHSPFAYYQANITEGVANLWGVEPWYQYVVWLGHGGWVIVLPIAALVLVGVRREWPLAFLAAGFIVPHLFVSHKEARFMLPIAPLLLALAAAGFGELYQRLDHRLRGLAFVVVLVLMTAAAVIRFPQIHWDIEPYRTTAELLHEAGRQADLTGIMVLGPDRTECGNYFYLRRDVPLPVTPDATLETLQQDPIAKLGRINYLICRTELKERFAPHRPEAVLTRGEFTLYRLAQPPGPKK